MREGAQRPIRTCIGCRRKKKKEEFLRFTVNPEGVLVLDEKKNVEGRGFYLCPDPVCIRMADKKRRRIGSLETLKLQHSLKKGSSQRRNGNGEK